MNARVNAFGTLTDPPVFATKAKKAIPVEKETLERIAEQNDFPSRQAKPPKAARPKPRTYRTGRNQQFNAKATPETVQRFYKAADEKRVTLGELLKQALDALDAMDALSKLADARKITLPELTKQAVEALERAGATGGNRAE